MEDKDTILAVRIKRSERKRYTDFCKKIDRKPSEMMREMITALCDERLTIEATEEMKTLKGIYK